MPKPKTLAQVLRSFQRSGCGLSDSSCFSVFVPLNDDLDFDRPFGLFTMGPGCDQAYYHGQTGTFYFARAVLLGPDVLACEEPGGCWWLFHRCRDRELVREVKQYRRNRPRVRQIEAAEIALRKAEYPSMAEYYQEKMATFSPSDPPEVPQSPSRSADRDPDRSPAEDYPRTRPAARRNSPY